MPIVHVYPGVADLARAAAERFVDLAAESIAARGRFLVALAGGSTPGETYSLLASDQFSAKVDWPRVHLLWGDERCVPPDHLESNYRMVRERLLNRVPLPDGNVHRIPCELSPEEAARAYEGELIALAAGESGTGREGGNAVPRLDLILLGMGEDGHTASIFPGSEALVERRRLALAQFVEKLHAWRVTMTPVVINAARMVTFLVAGSSKARTLRKALQASPEGAGLPVQVVQPWAGSLLWMVDEDAAALTGELSDNA